MAQDLTFENNFMAWGWGRKLFLSEDFPLVLLKPLFYRHSAVGVVAVWDFKGCWIPVNGQIFLVKKI